MVLALVLALVLEPVRALEPGLVSVPELAVGLV